MFLRALHHPQTKKKQSNHQPSNIGRFLLGIKYSSTYALKMWVLVVLWFFLLLMIFIYYTFHVVALFVSVFIVLVAWFSCGSSVVLSTTERTTKNPKNPKQNLCGSLEILYWQGLHDREPQEPQEPTFLFMYRVIENDSLNTWQANQENPHYGKSLLRIFRMWLRCVWWCWLVWWPHQLSRKSWHLGMYIFVS